MNLPDGYRWLTAQGVGGRRNLNAAPASALDLDDLLTRRQELAGLRKSRPGDADHLLVRSVPERNPDDLRRSAPQLDQIHEVPVLSHHHGARQPGGSEDLRIGSPNQVKLSHVSGFDAETPCHPRGQRR